MSHTFIKLRRGTAAEWAASQPQPGGEVLKLGEPGYEKDTRKLKIGDGVTGWNNLPYFADGIVDFPEELQDIIGNDFLIAGSGIGIDYNDLTNSLTIGLDNPTVELSDVTDLSVDARNFLLTPSSSNLAILVSDETGSGNLVFNSSPDFSGIPTVPTAPSGTNTNQIANTSFVRTEISNLVDSAPILLDTLNELAAALGDDANFATTITNSLANKANLSGATFTGAVSIPSGTGNFNSLNVNSVAVSISGHNHVYTDITNFASGVDSVLNTTLVEGSYIDLNYDTLSSTLTINALPPVTGISAGSNITVSNVSGLYTISTDDESSSLVTTVFNKTGSPIPKFSAVYINGGQGDQATINLAIANTEMGSSKTYGITAEAISNMSTGKVIVFGALTGVNTDQFNPTAPTGDVNGTILYLSPSVSGALTTTKPSAPNHIVSVGTIVRTHQNQGVVEVRIQNGFELEELHNVAISGITNNQVLVYQTGVDNLWKNTTLSSSYINDFSSSVSGLLPVKSILGGFGTSVSSSSGIYTINSTTTVVSLGNTSGTINTDASTGDIFDLTLVGNATLANPTNPTNGQTLRWRISQDGTGGRTVGLGTQFNIPSTATSPLPFSTGINAMDVLAATYHSGRAKWDVIAFVPGY